MTRLTMLFTLAGLAAIPAVAAGQQPAAADQPLMVHASSLQWNPLELPGFTPGLTLAVLQGDPAKDGQPYTVRLKFPAGYTFPAHFHPNPENVTVVSGKFLIGHGSKPDDSALQEYAPGDYLFIPGKSPHYGRVTGETVVQLHGMGPFAVMLAQPDKSK